MDIKLEKQTLGSLARLSNVSTTEQVKSYVEGYIKEYSNNAFVHLSGDSNIGTLELSGNLKTTKIEANNAEFGYNNHAELCSVAEGSTNNAIAPFSHAEGDGESYAGSKTFTIKTVSDNKLSITLDTDISQIQLSDELIIQNSGASDVKKITCIDAASKTIALDSIIGTNTNVGSYVMVMHKPWLGTVTRGDGAHVEGYKNMAFEDAHAENIMNAAYGKYSHCHGNANKAGWMATAFGTGNSALGNGSIALGGANPTNSKYAVCDTNAIVRGANSFAWSGNGKYEVTKGGTFNINPIGGAKGFYIGQQSLPDIIHEIAQGRNIDDVNSKIVKLDINGETLTATIPPTQIIDENINKFKSVYNSDTDEYEDIEKTIDEINDEVEHLYVMPTENDDEYNYYQIVIVNENDTFTYSWKKITEKAKASYIKKDGDTGIGSLQLTGNLSVEESMSIGNNSHPFGQYSFNVGNSTNTYNKYSVAEGWESTAGTKVFMIKSILSDENILSLDNTNGILPGHIISYKLDANYDAYSTVLSNLTNTTISVYPSITSFKNENDANRLNSSAKIWIVGHPEIGSQYNNNNNNEGACHAEGQGSIAQALAAHAEGCYTLAVGRYSHAEGNQTSALAYTSHASGANAKAEHQNSYVWSGGSLYSSHDAGTFNINPANGANGFYIGDKTLSDIIDNAIKEHDAKILKDIEFDTSSEQDIDYLVNTLSTIIKKLGGTVN